MKIGAPAEPAPWGNCTGTPEEVAEHPTSYTGRYLKKYLSE